MKVLIAHYSLLGHTSRLAEAAMQGVKEIEGAEAKLMRVPEILAEDEIKRRGAGDFRKSFENIPLCSPDDVAMADANRDGDARLVKGQRIDDKQKAAPLTIENMDPIAIKETPAISFYNGLGNLKGVDMTTASLGFTIINTRGFNSTSPVRSLQILTGWTIRRRV